MLILLHIIMKTLSSLLLLIMSVGCSSDFKNLEYEEEFIEDDSEEENFDDFYFDSSSSKDEKLNCPSFYQKIKLKNVEYLIEIPSECHLNYIETGRPSPDQEHEYQNNIILEPPHSQQEY